ncbi:hypothetical protein [Streptomyces sp. RerS4]|uniref:hypothetical protein n=1 Tax=Streptomyces sp. RerS4 TaxID=2942449 RepID=UPI00201C582C|nr:hypothetical protein [Streptomyces sp. RerS4]UQX02231.1 hypothetical protein M4D82_18360 [Streptomyces sp. RerS4]
MRLLLTVREGDLFVGACERPLIESLMGALKDGDVAQETAGWILSGGVGLPARPDVAALAPDRWRHVHDRVFAECVELDVEPGATIAALQSHALNVARQRGSALPERHPSTIERVWLADLFTDRALDPQETVWSAGLRSDDDVVLYIRHEIRHSYSLGPVPNPQAMFSVLQAAAASRGERPALWGALLYTDADTGLARHVREYFDELNALSGPDLLLFVVERPASWRSAKRYWRRALSPELYRTFAALRWLRWQPYERHLVYELARDLGVPVARLPCLVLFHDVHDPHKAVFPLASTSPAYLRHLFSRVHAAVRPGAPGFREAAAEDITGEREAKFRAATTPQGTPEHTAALKRASALLDSPLTDGYDRVHPPLDLVRNLPAGTPEGAAALDRVRAETPDINRELGAIAAEAAEETRAMTQNNFHFHGRTTFINQPVDTVISDFQNDHRTGPGAAELVRVLRLVLTSRDLADADRQEAATLVHAVADDLAGGDPDGRAPTRLERLRALVAGAADIAQPVAALIATLSGLTPL